MRPLKKARKLVIKKQTEEKKDNKSTRRLYYI